MALWFGFSDFMRFKIQMASVNGWSDLRSSIDGEAYEVCFYATEAEAEAAREDFRGLSEYLESFQIVPETEPETENIYE